MDNDVLLLMKSLNKSALISLYDVMEETGSTKRQVMYRLNKFNSILEEENLPQIEIDIRKGFIIDTKTRQYITHYLYNENEKANYYLNKEERLIFIYLALFIKKDYISLQHLIDYLEVSKSTVLVDLKDLLLLLEDESVDIQYTRALGYHLVGDETRLRRVMMQQIMHVISSNRNTLVLDRFIDVFHTNTYEYSKLIIQELATKHQIVFVEDRLMEFIYIFIFLKERFNHVDEAMEITSKTFEVMESFKEYAFTKDLFAFFKELDGVSLTERWYVTSWIVGISVANVDNLSEDCLIIAEIVGKVMTRFELISGIHYIDIEPIFRQIFAHFRPAYYRLLFNLPIYNPLKDRVKKEYGELYQLVKETMHPFTSIFKGEIPDDELAYLTMHFASIYGGNASKENLHRTQAMIVCTNGIGTSAILFNELKEMFPEINFLNPIDISSLDLEMYPVDIIFTTQMFYELNKIDLPVIKVSPIMDINERYRVMREVDAFLGSMTLSPSMDEIMQIVDKYIVSDQDKIQAEKEILALFTNRELLQETDNKSLQLEDMVDVSIIARDIEATTPQEVILNTGKIMVEAGYVSQNYVDSIASGKKHQLNSLVITPHIALPHTQSKYGAIKPGLGIMSLKDPVVFGNVENDPVKYIFFLSALDHEAHLPAMTKLLDLLKDDVFLDMLDTFEDEQEILNYIIDLK